MGKFYVRYKIEARCEIEVEADNHEEAKEQAEYKFFGNSKNRQ